MGIQAKCENWSPNTTKQHQEENIKLHPFIAGQVKFTLFRHWTSVSLFLASPLYSFSQRLHTEERQTVRRRVPSVIREGGGKHG